jgi:hypothetical protein
MRFIPHLLRVKSDKHQKIIKWRYKQKSFLEGVESIERPLVATSCEILHLDKEIEGFGTLRKNIMEISCKNKIEESLFLSVDTSFFRSNEVLFHFYHETILKPELLSHTWYHILDINIGFKKYISSRGISTS